MRFAHNGDHGDLRPNLRRRRSKIGVFFVLRTGTTKMWDFFEDGGSSKNIPTCSIQNSDILRARQFGATHGEAAGRGAAGQDGTPTGRFAWKTTVSLTLQTIEHTCPEHFVKITNEKYI